MTFEPSIMEKLPVSLQPSPLSNIYVLYAAGGIVLSLVLYLCVNEVIRNRARVSGFNGPKGWPVVGNLFQVLDNSAHKYQQWAKTFGAVYQIQLANTPVIVVNSGAAAKKLFITNSHAFSSRPISYTFGKVRLLGESDFM